MGVATGNLSATDDPPFKADYEATSKQSVGAKDKDRSGTFGNTAQSRDYLSLLARATNDAVRDWDVKTGKLCWPQGLCALFGYSEPNELRISFWDERLHPDDHARIKVSITQALASGEDHWTGEYRFRAHDGKYLDVLEHAFILRDTKNAPVRLIGALMDITERKQLHDHLSRSQKMEAFGQLAGGVAHDFNNFLTTILGYSDLVLVETGGKGRVASHVNEILKAAGRASALTSQLLAFSRKQALEPQVIEVNALVTNLERSLLRLLGENIAVRCDLHRDKRGAHIKVDAGQLTQIIMNLALNCRDAMPGGGELTLETATVELPYSDAAADSAGIAAGEYVVIRVIDSGTGMTEVAKAHLFEPFFTTKSDGRSSGLGLATSYGIVSQSGGRIEVESELGKGTTVHIYLPRVAAPPPPGYRKPGSRFLPTGTESILVVEDDVSVRHISVRVLRNLGYDVIEAASCLDAQRLLQERGDRRMHLLLTDMVMPQMSGRDFASWLRTVSPQTRVVFVSGYLEDSLHPHERIEPGTFFLSKPYDPEQLATTIRQALDS